MVSFFREVKQNILKHLTETLYYNQINIKIMVRIKRGFLNH